MIWFGEVCMRPIRPSRGGEKKKTELQLPSLFRPDLHRHDASVAFFGTHQKGPLRPEVAERDILPRVRYGREDPDDPRMALQEHLLHAGGKGEVPLQRKGPVIVIRFPRSD